MAENMIKFLRGNVASLPQTATAGAVYFTKDEGLYLGLEDGSYHRYGDFITVADVASLPESGAHETCMYYCESENILAKWDKGSGKWTQINAQKTLSELGGVAKSVYEAKMAALEKADSDNATAIDNLGKYVGNLPEGTTATTVIDYVNKKTEGIATDAALGELNSQVAGLQTAVQGITADYLKATDKTELEGKITAVETAVDTEKTRAEGIEAGLRTDVDAIKGDYLKGADKTALQDNIDAVDEKVDGVIADYLKASDKTELEGKIATDVAAAVKVEKEAREAADTAINNKIGTVAEGTTIVKMIEDAQAAATYDDTGVKADIKAIADDYLKKADKETLQGNIDTVSGKVDTLNGNAETEGSVDYKIAQAVAAIMENPDDTMNSINELVTWIDGHAEDALELSNQVTTNKNDIATLNGLVGTTGVAAQIEAAITEALKVEGKDKYALATELAAAIERIVALEAIDHDHSNKTVLDGITAEKVAAWDKAEENAEAHADSLNSAMNTRVVALEAIDHDHTNKDELDLIASGDKAKWDTAAGKAHEHANSAELAKIADGDVAKWNAAEQNAKDYSDGKLSTAKSDLEGKITAAETAAKGYADTEVGKVQSALDTYKESNNTAVAGKADKATTLAGYGITDAMTVTQIEALLTWGEFN